MEATAPLYADYLEDWHNIFRKEAKQRAHDVNASLGIGGPQKVDDPFSGRHNGGRKSRRHAKKSRRHGKKSRRHAKKSRR